MNYFITWYVLGLIGYSVIDEIETHYKNKPSNRGTIFLGGHTAFFKGFLWAFCGGFLFLFAWWVLLGECWRKIND